MPAFNFDSGMQRSILRMCMVDDVFCQRAMQHVDVGFFTTQEFGWIFNMRGAPGVNHHDFVRIFLEDMSGCSRMIQVNVGQENVRDIGEIVSPGLHT